MMGSSFFWGGRGGEEFFLFICSQCVLIMFPWASPSSHVVPQDVPNNTSILSHMICPKFNSHVYKLKKVRQRGTHLFPFCNRDPKRWFLLGMAQCSKNNWWWANQCNVPPQKRKEKKGVNAPPMKKLIWITICSFLGYFSYFHKFC